MFIEIKDSTVEVKRGNAKATGKAYEIQEQTGYMVTEDERKRIVVPLRNGQSPFAPGRYVISAESFVVDQFGGLKIGRLVLLPAAQPQSKVA
jgi:hypothetical protein